MIVERAVPDNTIRMDSFRVMRRSLFSTASLYLDFSTNYGFTASIPSSASSLLTTTRASTGYADTLSGTYLPFLSGIPRITDKGLLVEEARTNSIRNNSMQGAVAGTPGTPPTNWVLLDPSAGLARSIVGFGTINGIDYIDVRYAGTTSTTSMRVAFENNSQIVASIGQTWTGSMFIALVAGSFANITSFYNNNYVYDGGGVAIESINGASFTGTLTSSLVRNSVTGTIAGATAASIRPGLELIFASGVAIDFTLRIGWPQLELGAFATSPIRTTSASATRAADAISMTIPALPSAYTLFGQATALNGVQTSGTPTLMQVDDGTLNNRALIARTILSQAGTIVLSGGVAQAAPGNTAWSNAARGKTALAVALDDFAFVFNGGSPATDASGSIPAGSLTTLRIGSNTAAYFGGTIERIALFPTRLTNAQLQASTA